jgi:diguanylate cyclase (GGDEF)-like protein
MQPDTNLEAARIRVMERMAALLESQIRTQTFSDGVAELSMATHRDIIAQLHGLISQGGPQALVAGLDEIVSTCQRLDSTLSLLSAERHRQRQHKADLIRATMQEFSTTIDDLAETLIEKNLLDRQRQVLERIILSHENVTQWQEFVQEILLDFHAIFPFNFFFIAFVEENGLALHLYYRGHYAEDLKEAARRKLSQQMLATLGLPSDAPLDIAEYEVGSGEASCAMEDIRLLTVAVPGMEPGLAGILGAAFASASGLTVQEESVIRSILAVMVMVVGSSKALSRTLAELEYYSMHDPLTGLYNRRYFNQMLEYEIGRSERHKHDFCLLLIDLDDFKDINDSYGHPVGDETLRGVAEILQAHVRKGDLATRIGGDEFMLLLSETPQAGGVIAAQSLGKALRERVFSLPDGRTFHLTISIGVATFPGDGENPEDLLANVDIAVYRAKDLGKDGVCSSKDLDVSMVQSNRNTREYAEKLRTALAEDRIIPYFHPILDCKTGALFAHETLARLIEPNGETISAGVFIEALEKYGMGRELDRAMIHKGFGALAKHIQSVEKPTRLFVNLSAQEIQGRNILGYAEELCEELTIPPHLIVFEILERDAISDMTNMRKFLTKLREKGFSFALDDFGSGYNSFHYLRELHFDFVKIDGAFVRNILNSKVDYALVRNLSRLCQDIGIKTVAEFVENAEVLKALQHMGIDYVQGFHFGLPMPQLGRG